VSPVGRGIVGVLVAETSTETAVGLAGAAQGKFVQPQTAFPILTVKV
jgi:hypothetical protein